jgi:nucleotide-binding universal stress UspA family protein
MIKTILVAYDGSVHAARALALAADAALRYGAEVHLVHVIPRLEVPEELKEFARVEGVDSQTVLALRQVADSVLGAAQAGLAAKGVTAAQAVVLTGDPAEELLGYAREHGVGLVVMGRRGLGRIRGLLLGSVSSKVLALAECPVLTVR